MASKSPATLSAVLGSPKLTLSLRPRIQLQGEITMQRLGPRIAGALLGLLLALSAASARAVDVTGHWRVTITTPDGSSTGEAAFQQHGHSVTGWLGPSADDPIPITLVLKGNKLTIKTHPQPGRTVAFDTCQVTVNGDKMTGTIDAGKGTIELVKSKPADRR